MNVPEFLDIRKEPGRSIFLSAVIIVVGLASFGLGRLSAQYEAVPSQTSVRLVEESDAGATGEVEETGSSVGGPGTSVATAIAGGVVASKSGTKYHAPWCSGAKSIKESNRIWFATTAEARAAGYEPASNCKGLE
jgi:hypothetical protein